VRSLRPLLLAVALLPAAMAAIAAGEAPRSLTGRGLENLTAYAHLLSLIRFFHPSDAAAAASWNRVAVAGVGAVEAAADPEALARALEEFFRPLAPALRVYLQGQRPETPPELHRPAGGGPFRIVAWRHFGGHFDGRAKVFASERIDDHSPPGFGTLVQAIAPGTLKGRRVRLRAEVKVEAQAGGFAQLGLRVDREGGKPGFLDNMADRPIRDPTWHTYEIEGDVAPDAERIVVLLVLTGGGRAWIDDVSLAAVPAGDADGGAALLVNAGFEDGETGRQPPGWYFPYEAVRSGYHLLLRRGEPCRHGGCAEVASDDIATPFIRPPADALEVSLPGGAAAAVPLSLWADAAGTLPHPAPGAPAGAWAGVDPSADTRAARLATVALVWGIQQHFHPELDPASPDWIAALPAALDGAARAPDREAFRRVLRRLLVPLGDVRTLGVFHRGDPATGLPPIAWALVEDRLVVTGAAADAGGLRPGDVIATIDGRPAAEALADAESLASGPLPATRRWRALELLAEGQAGSRLVLGAERAGGAPFTVSLTRAAAAQPVPDTPLPTVAEPRPGIVYADLRRMADADLDSLLPRLAAAKGIVFDLRGETDVSTVLLSHLAERTAMSSNWQVPVVMLPDHHDVKWLTTFWTIEPKAPRLRGKVAFLTDGRAIGYSETLLGMIERYRWAELVGEPSGADNGSLNWSDLPGGWRVTWSGQRVLKHDGSPFHGVGELPTVPATRTLRGIAAGRDEIVERAVEVVAGR
jgi:hypothetical protein